MGGIAQQSPVAMIWLPGSQERGQHRADRLGQSRTVGIKAGQIQAEVMRGDRDCLSAFRLPDFVVPVGAEAAKPRGQTVQLRRGSAARQAGQIQLHFPDVGTAKLLDFGNIQPGIQPLRSVEGTFSDPCNRSECIVFLRKPTGHRRILNQLRFVKIDFQLAAPEYRVGRFKEDGPGALGSLLQSDTQRNIFSGALRCQCRSNDCRLELLLHPAQAVLADPNASV